MILHSILGLALAALPPNQQSESTRQAHAENVLILIADDLGIDKVGAYGFVDSQGQPLAARTPNIDRLAGEGLLFRNAWAAPSCSNCRAELLTGRYANRTGIGTRVQVGIPDTDGMRDDELTLADLLPVEYFSAVVGKWHLGGDGPLGSVTAGIDHAPRCGFDLHFGSQGNLGPQSDGYFDWRTVVSWFRDLNGSLTLPVVGEYATSHTTSSALRIIESLEDRPFFLWVAYNAPHNPLHVPPAELFDGNDLALGTNVGKVKAMIEAMDTEIGRLLNGIRPAVLERTTLLFLGDNGTNGTVVEPPWAPGKAKGTVYNGGVQVPFIVKSPRIPAEHRGSECELLIDVTDVLPTVAELLEVPVPSDIDGRSFLTYLRIPTSPSRREWIFAERFDPNFVPSATVGISTASLEQHDQAVRGDRYKLIRKWRAALFGQPETEVFEFYDLRQDFFELTNLLDDQGQPPARLRAEFDRLRRVLQRMSS